MHAAESYIALLKKDAFDVNQLSKAKLMLW